jgi:hypothetical protein
MDCFGQSDRLLWAKGRIFLGKLIDFLGKVVEFFYEKLIAFFAQSDRLFQAG